MARHLPSCLQQRRSMHRQCCEAARIEGPQSEPETQHMKGPACSLQVLQHTVTPNPYCIPRPALYSLVLLLRRYHIGIVVSAVREGRTVQTRLQDLLCVSFPGS